MKVFELILELQKINEQEADVVFDDGFVNIEVNSVKTDTDEKGLFVILSEA